MLLLAQKKRVLFPCQNIHECDYIPAPITAKINLLLASLRIFWQSIKS